MEAGDTVNRREIPFEFHGSGSEYFRIWIVNLLLTILTLGIYSAWAKVRRLRYFYGNTMVDGSAFEYHGQPRQILKGRAIVFGAYVVFAVLGQFLPLLNLAIFPLIVLGLPWVIMRGRLFQLRMSSWRGIRFNFHGKYLGALAAFVGWGLLTILTLGLLLPAWGRKRVAYTLDNTSFGTRRFSFTTGVGRYYAIFFATLGLFLLVVALSGAGLALSGFALPQGDEPPDLSAANIVAVVAGYAGLIAVGAYANAALTNAAFGGLVIGPHAMASAMRPATLASIYVTNALLLIVTLGLYYPWARVRLHAYQVRCLTLLAAGGLDDVTADAAGQASATGEEAADFFDVDFGI